MPKKRIVEVDILHGIAAIFLIIDHSIITTPINLLIIPWCKELSEFIATFDMPLFFLISGFVYVCNDYSIHMRKKVYRIGIPYLVFGAGSVLLHSVAGGFSAGGGYVDTPRHKGYAVIRW